jgi:response regulator RpfG family c-di-GMP phosphodiesterase
MNQKTVLCVDDETNVLNSLKRLLRREPFRLLTARGGEEALAVLAREEVHLIISDYRMPEMTGTQFLSQVATQYPDTIRVVLSGYADAAAIVAAINQGHIARFLAKPWDDEELKANLKSCLEQHDLLLRNRALTDELAQRNAELRSLTERQQSLIEERTRSLQMAQEIVQALPLPVIGVSRDGTIALANNVADAMLESPVGSQIRELFPAELIDAVNRCFDTRQSSNEEATVELSNKTWNAVVRPLTREGEIRGSVVLLEESPCVV